MVDYTLLLLVTYRVLVVDEYTAGGEVPAESLDPETLFGVETLAEMPDFETLFAVEALFAGEALTGDDGAAGESRTDPGLVGDARAGFAVLLLYDGTELDG